MTTKRKARPRGGPWQCHRCGTVHTAYAAAERCADSHGGARIVCLFVLRLLILFAFVMVLATVEGLIGGAPR